MQNTVIIAVEITKREKNNTQERPVVHITTAQHLLTFVQAVPQQWSVPSGQLPPSIYIYQAGHSMVWNIPLARFRSAVLAVSLPVSSAPPHWQSRGNKKLLDLGSASLSNN